MSYTHTTLIHIQPYSVIHHTLIQPSLWRALLTRLGEADDADARDERDDAQREQVLARQGELVLDAHVPTEAVAELGGAHDAVPPQTGYRQDSPRETGLNPDRP